MLQRQTLEERKKEKFRNGTDKIKKTYSGKRERNDYIFREFNADKSYAKDSVLNPAFDASGASSSASRNPFIHETTPMSTNPFAPQPPTQDIPLISFRHPT